jgi:ribosomal protein L11 methyltransferase
MVGSSFPHRAPKTWNKIVIEVDLAMTEAVAAYLEGLSENGIEISSSVENPMIEKITAYIPIGSLKSERKAVSEKIDKLKGFLADLPTIFKDCSSARLSTEILMEEDWGETWKSFFTSFQITPTLTIKPSWEEIKSGSGKENTTNAIIEMDPGLAFGTGHHASTQLALLLLEELFGNNQGTLKNIIDVGTGSGILAMGCALFGAKNVLAIDNDPDAVEAAKRNIIRNSLEHIVHVSGHDIASIQPGCDLLVANITHDTLAGMTSTICNLLAPNGYLVLSGILKEDQENSIRNIYIQQGLNYIKSLTKDEWVALLFQKIE